MTFRDISETITQGETVEDALVMVREALETTMKFYFEDKRCVPTPSKPKRSQQTIELPQHFTPWDGSLKVVLCEFAWLEVLK